MKERIVGIDLGINSVDGIARYNTNAWQMYRDFAPRYAGGVDNCLATYNSTKRNTNATLDTSAGLTGYQQFESTKRRSPAFNDCWNQKVVCVNYPFYVACKTGAGWPVTILVTPYYRLPIPAKNVIVEDGTFNGSESASARAWWSMQPRFQGEVALLNSIYELKDFRDAGKALLNLELEIYNISKTIKSLIRRYKGAPTKLLADGWLSYALMVKPTLTDITSISAQLRTIVAEKQKEFANLGNELQTSHYSEILESTSSAISYNDYYPCWFNGTSRTRKFTATLQYKYKYSMRKPIDAMMRYWGIEGNLEVLWNALPFTWVADYFIKVGDSLHYMVKDPNVCLDMRQYSESILTTHTNGQHIGHLGTDFESVIEGTYRTFVGTTPPVLVSGYSASTYVRRVCEPNKGLALPRLKYPNTNQGRTLLALARSLC